MKKRKSLWIVFAVLAVLLLTASAIWLYYASDPWGFARSVSPEEAALRMQIVETAETYLGCNEADGSHRQIIDIYNSHEPLAQGYEVQYTDSWCATFVSAISIRQGLTELIPTECGCERQIALFQELHRWQEKDFYVPLPGDIIYYAWDEKSDFGECTGWADHVGIVVGTAGPMIKVIEGNKEDCVAYRYIPINHSSIRGYAIPDYGNKAD